MINASKANEWEVYRFVSNKSQRISLTNHHMPAFWLVPVSTRTLSFHNPAKALIPGMLLCIPFLHEQCFFSTFYYQHRHSCGTIPALMNTMLLLQVLVWMRVTPIAQGEWPIASAPSPKTNASASPLSLPFRKNMGLLANPVSLMLYTINRYNHHHPASSVLEVQSCKQLFADAERHM